MSPPGTPPTVHRIGGSSDKKKKKKKISSKKKKIPKKKIFFFFALKSFLNHFKTILRVKKKKIEFFVMLKFALRFLKVEVSHPGVTPLPTRLRIGGFRDSKIAFLRKKNLSQKNFFSNKKKFFFFCLKIIFKWFSYDFEQKKIFSIFFSWWNVPPKF